MNNALPPLRSLSVLANPLDLPRFDDDLLWQQTVEVLQPLQRQSSLLLERLQPPSLNALRNSLDSNSWNILHLAVHGHQQAAARYGTIALLSSGGQALQVSAQALAALLAAHSSVTLVILQSVDDGPPAFDILVGELIARGISTVVLAPRLRERSQHIFISRLYNALLSGLTGSQLADDLAAAHGMPGLDLVQVRSRNPQQPIVALPSINSSPVSVDPPAIRPSSDPPWREILRQKRQANHFDVFLCHNSADKPAVRRIGDQLKEAGLLPWLDVDELPPGQPWQPLLEQQIQNIRAAAVCFGAAGIGPWQEREMYGFLSAFVKRGVPVIPLLLPDAPSTPELPVFLSAMTWVDFRLAHSNSLTQLIWGITGKRPDL
jgi:hypothetical protein